MVNVQAQCLAAVAEGSTHPVTLRLSKMGATGKHTNNIERDFGRWIKKFAFQLHSILRQLTCYAFLQTFMMIVEHHTSVISLLLAKGLPTSSILLPVKSRFKGKKWVRRGKVFGTTKRPLAGIKLSAYIKMLAESPSLFRQYFLGNTTTQDRVAFWNAASKDPRFKEIGLPAPQEFPFTIPFKIYGDKGPYFKNHGLQLMSVSSLFSHSGNTLKSRLLLCHYIAVRIKLTPPCYICFVNLVHLRFKNSTGHSSRRFPSTSYGSYNFEGNRNIGHHSQLVS